MSSQQHPLPSGFGSVTSTTDVIEGVDLSGRTAIVTGGASGLGVETVRALAAAGADVVVPARDTARAAEALSGIGAEIAEMDLMEPASVDRFAAEFVGSGRPLNVLINSAGIMAAPLARDSRGYESHFATNHLGHFQLTARLWPALAAAGQARVVALSSWGHRYSRVIFDDINFQRRKYVPLEGYGQSKTANALFAVELDKRARLYGVRAFAVHPGSAYTRLARYTSQEELRKIGVIDENGEAIVDSSRSLKSVAQGAATSVWCEAPSMERDPSLPQGVMPYAVDPATAIKLWSVSQEMTGVEFAI
jgi:NAD(P)-dependent dehydrogenase (short-subunit alcohol dehydrogenase family)